MKISLVTGVSAILLIAAAGASPAQAATHSRPDMAAARPSAAVQPTTTSRWTLTPYVGVHVNKTALGPTKLPYFKGQAQLPAGSRPGSAPSPRSVTSSAGPRIVLYNGLNKAGISAAEAGGAGTPPDSTGAIGPNHYVEMANGAIHVWDRSLNSISLSSLDNFTGSGAGVSWCDVQVQWDPAAGRWLFEMLFCNAAPGGGGQGFVFGWSKTADPSNLVTGWCFLSIGTGNLLLDYPKLGHNTNWLIIGGNFYDFSVPSPNPPFVSAGLAWVHLPANGVATCPTVFPAWGHTNPGVVMKNGDGFTPSFTPVPVNTISGAADGYIVSAYDPGGNVVAATPQTKLAVWHIGAGGGLHQDSDITVNSFAAPPPATQTGSTNVIDTLDGRLTQAVGDPTTGIWTQHTVKNAVGPVSKATWYELQLAAGTNLGETQEGDVTHGSDYVFDAAVSPTYNQNGAAVIAYTRSGSTDPVIAAQVRVSSTPAGTMAAGELVLATSPSPDTDFSCNNPTPGIPCRWGDYSAATPDPVNTFAVWGTNMYNAAAGPAPAWQNENFAIAAWVAPGAPTNVLAKAGDASACVRWTLSTIDDGGAPDVSYTIKAYQGVTLIKSVVIGAPAGVECVQGLTNGLAYTFTVTATDAAGSSPESVASAPVTPNRSATGSPGAGPPGRGGAPPAPPKPPGPR